VNFILNKRKVISVIIPDFHEYGGILRSGKTQIFFDHPVTLVDDATAAAAAAYGQAVIVNLFFCLFPSHQTSCITLRT